MVRSNVALWMRGMAVGAAFTLAVMVTGCAVQTADEIPEPDEGVAEAEELLEQNVTRAHVSERAEEDSPLDPQPVPWHGAPTNDPNPTDPGCLKQKAPEEAASQQESNPQETSK